MGYRALNLGRHIPCDVEIVATVIIRKESLKITDQPAKSIKARGMTPDANDCVVDHYFSCKGLRNVTEERQTLLLDF